MNQTAQRRTAEQLQQAAGIERFMSACQKADANAIASFAPKVIDWKAANAAPHLVGANMPKRMQTLAEVLQDSLGNGSGPNATQLMQLVLNLAFGSDTHANQSRHARQLLADMADSWTNHYFFKV